MALCKGFFNTVGQNCFRYPEEDIIIISKPLLQLREDANKFLYEKYLLDALPFTPEEETEIREFLGINSDGR